jgi:hypothetical protein
MKKFLIPLGVGVVVFGAVTAFAASLTVNTTSLGSGNATVASCNSSASVSYNTAPTTNAKTYDVTTAPVASASGCSGMAVRVTLLGASNVSLGEKTATLDSSGSALPDFTSLTVPATDVVGVAVVITG